MNQQTEQMAKAKKCNTCTHNAVCEKLEEFRDPLGWVNTENEFCCSYYRKSTDVARNIFHNLRILGHIDFDGNFCIRKDSFEALEKKYEDEGV